MAEHDNRDGHLGGYTTHGPAEHYHDGNRSYDGDVLPLGPPRWALINRDLWDQHVEAEESQVHASIFNRPVESQPLPSGYGNTVVPKEKTLWGYKSVLREGDGANGIEFNPAVYGLFDGIIVQKCGVDDKGEATHPAFNGGDYYNQFAPLRRNIAILRNYLMEHYPPEKNPENIERLQRMSEMLGDALAGKDYEPTLLERATNTIAGFLPGRNGSDPYISKFMQAANMPDEGAAVMYQYLYQKDKPNFDTGIKGKEWGDLKPLEETPFSDHNMRNYSGAARMQAIVDSFDSVVGDLYSVDRLQDKERRISVEEGHRILEKLRVNLATGQDEKVINLLDPKIRESQALLTAAIAYRTTIANIADADPSALNDPSLNLGNTLNTMEKIDYRLKVEQQRMLSMGGWPSHARAMGGRISRTPRQFKNEEPIEKLIDELDNGLEKAGVVEKRVVSSPSRSSSTPSRSPSRPSSRSSSSQASRSLSQQPSRSSSDRRNSSSRSSSQSSSQSQSSSNPFKWFNPYRAYYKYKYRNSGVGPMPQHATDPQAAATMVGFVKSNRPKDPMKVSKAERENLKNLDLSGVSGVVQGGKDTFANPKISQINNPNYVKMAEEANREHEKQVQNDLTGGPNLSGR